MKHARSGARVALHLTHPAARVIAMSRTAAGPFQCILCPVDFSSNSRGALRYAAALADLSGAQLFVLYVDDPLLATVAASRPDAKSILTSNQRALRRFIEAAVPAAAPRSRVTMLSVAGSPAREIVRTAEAHSCDLIVMGHRGAGRTSRLLFGSTTEGVVRTADVPVLVVPPSKRGARLPSTRKRLDRAS
jgi:nucleotide-binding universal stress UspA family protein